MALDENEVLCKESVVPLYYRNITDEGRIHCKKNITVAKASECDKPEISKFMNDVFFKTEPTSIICGVSEKDSVSQELLELVTYPLDEKLSFVARRERKDKTKTLVGVAINGSRSAAYESEYWETAMEEIKCEKERELLMMWQQISKLPKDSEQVCGSACRLVELEYLSVHPHLQRQGIAREMLMKSMKEARNQGYCLMRMDCTSAFSAALGECAGMKRIDEIYYKELRDSNGKRFRNVEPPHIKAVILMGDLTRK